MTATQSGRCGRQFVHRLRVYLERWNYLTVLGDSVGGRRIGGGFKLAKSLAANTNIIIRPVTGGEQRKRGVKIHVIGRPNFDNGQGIVGGIGPPTAPRVEFGSHMMKFDELGGILGALAKGQERFSKKPIPFSLMRYRGR
ncbi:MAG TPA: hypothetical protein VL970_10855 [Candidatus Acidoferrales bacterium]|nr:hypothetical protein [Candidatus Acidoferrales bacterium]